MRITLFTSAVFAALNLIMAAPVPVPNPNPTPMNQKTKIAAGALALGVLGAGVAGAVSVRKSIRINGARWGHELTIDTLIETLKEKGMSRREIIELLTDLHQRLPYPIA
jgi:hypothetical protein